MVRILVAVLSTGVSGAQSMAQIKSADKLQRDTVGVEPEEMGREYPSTAD